MFEGFRSFSDYVQEYDLERVEGLLLRHLHSVYKVPEPDGPRRRQERRRARDRSSTCATCCGQVDSSLSTSGSGCATRATSRPGRAARTCGRRVRTEPPDVTRDVQGLHRRHPHAHLRIPPCVVDRAMPPRWRSSTHPRDGQRGAVDDRAPACEPRGPIVSSIPGLPSRPRGPEPPSYRRESPQDGRLGLARGADARGRRRTERLWVAEFEVDLAASREAGQPVLRLLRLGSLV
jgi:hypothetical protein